MKTLLNSTAAGVLAAACVGWAASAEMHGIYAGADGSTIEFAADGVFNVALADGTTFSEAYTIDGDTVTLSATADSASPCAGHDGSYTMAHGEDGLTFALVSETCELRSDGMTAGAFAKVAHEGVETMAMEDSGEIAYEATAAAAADAVDATEEAAVEAAGEAVEEASEAAAELVDDATE